MTTRGARIGTLLLLWCAMAAAIAGRADAQATGDISVTIQETNVTGFPTVRLTLAVQDAEGAFVPELTVEAFEVREAGVDIARPILSVEAGGEGDDRRYEVTYYSGHDCDGERHTVQVTVDAPAGSGSAVGEIGPLVNNPGCNILTPTPTHTPLPPTATQTATPTATSSATATATATAIATATTGITPRPSPTVTVTPPLFPPDAGDDDRPVGDIPTWGWVLGIGVILTAGGAIYWAVTRPRKCIVCGNRVPPGEEYCPNCGAPQRFGKR